MMLRRAQKEIDAIKKIVRDIDKSKLNKAELKEYNEAMESLENYQKKVKENEGLLNERGESTCFFGDPVFSTL